MNSSFLIFFKSGSYLITIIDLSNKQIIDREESVVGVKAVILLDAIPGTFQILWISSLTTLPQALFCYLDPVLYISCFFHDGKTFLWLIKAWFLLHWHSVIIVPQTK